MIRITYWIIAEDPYAGGIRSMSNPNTFNHPDTYLGTNWFDTSSPIDNGGVHINSGVQNYYSGTFWINAFPPGATVTWYPPYDWNYSTSGNTLYLYDIQNPQAGAYYLSILVESNGESAWRSTSIDIYQCYSCLPGEICPTIAGSANP